MKTESIVLLDQAAGQKQISILDAFKSKYKNRVIIAGTINARGKQLEKGIVWEKAMPYNRSNIFIRTLSWFVFSIQALLIIKMKYKNADLFIITNPPLSVFLPFFINNNFDVLVFDLYPDALVEYNYFSKKSLIYKIWGKLNVKLYKKARRVFTLSDGMAESLSTYVDPAKIEIVPLWTDNKFLYAIPKKENSFIKEQGLEDKFVIMYSGNMGLTHPVEILYDFAEILKDEKDIFILLIGGGHKFKMLEKKIQESGLSNISILPWQSSDKLPLSMNAANVGVVTLDAEASKLSVPSKIFDLFSIGLPVLAIGSPDSELASLLNKYESGKCFSIDDLLSVKAYILQLKENNDYYQLLSKNSLKASLNHTPSNAQAFL